MIDSRVVGESRVRFLTECRGYAGLGEKTRWDQIKGQEGSFFALEPKGNVCLKEQLAPGGVNGRLTNIEKKKPRSLGTDGPLSTANWLWARLRRKNYQPDLDLVAESSGCDKGSNLQLSLCVQAIGMTKSTVRGGCKRGGGI